MFYSQLICRFQTDNNLQHIVYGIVSIFAKTLKLFHIDSFVVKYILVLFLTHLRHSNILPIFSSLLYLGFGSFTKMAVKLLNSSTFMLRQYIKDFVHVRNIFIQSFHCIILIF